MSALSMTGFGRFENTSSTLQVSVEIKTVNHRFLDIGFKLPGAYSALEGELTKLIRQSLRRGRVDVFVTRKELAEKPGQVKFDRQLFRSCFDVASQVLREEAGADTAVLGQAALQILQRREVLDIDTTPVAAGEELALVKPALLEALAQVQKMREAEGLALEREVLSRLEIVKAASSSILSQSADMVDAYRGKLNARLEKLLAGVDLDAGRVAQEVAVFAERCDVTEEVARLDSHFEQFQRILCEPACGRKLDFLIQEMGREVNTIGSKSQSSQISSAVVEMKAELEKVREQVQNIE